MSAKNSEGVSSATAEGNAIDIRKEYLRNFHRSCRPSPSPDVGDDGHQSLRTRLQRININGDKKSSLTVSDVPIEAMKHIAAFLPAPSQALLAISFELSRNETQDIVMGNTNWRTLDFGEIEKTLAERLTDADIRSILLCIDSVRKVRKLRMTNCINITGTGLEPLRGSRIMEHVDLSLVPDHTSQSLYPNTPLSQEIVLPILATFMGRKLKLIEFPKAWRDEAWFEMDDEEDVFCQFLDNFVLSMNGGRGFRCKECQQEIPPNFSDECQATQRYVCYKCYDCYCDECDYNVELCFCDKCERHYCDNCVEHKICGVCDRGCCAECATFSYCEECDVYVCSDCVIESSCQQCDKTIRQCTCGTCYDEKCGEFSCHQVNQCSYCPYVYCKECIESGCLSKCYSCRSYHCYSCAEEQNLHSCAEYEYCGKSVIDFSSCCNKCRLGTVGFRCKRCFEDVCPGLLKRHLSVVEENDTLRKEIATLAMKLQHAKDNVAVAENDVEIVMSQAGCSRAKAIKALVDSDNDTVEAIMSLV